MSRFLGPIHHWLFNKIDMYEKLEETLITEVSEKLDIDLTAMVSEATEQYGAPTEKKPLEALIDTNNIHGWLQSRINAAELRVAYMITQLIDEHGEKVYAVLQDVHKAQGAEAGDHAKANYPVATAPELYKALNNYILDGMPCDHVNNMTIQQDNLLEWQVVSCLHKKYWDVVSGNIHVFYDLRYLWISEFINHANSAFTYKFNNNDGVLTHQILKA